MVLSINRLLWFLLMKMMVDNGEIGKVADCSGKVEPWHII